MDLRDFISGDKALKDLGASQVVMQSVVFALRMVDIIEEHVSDLPDEMHEQLIDAVDMFMSGVGEFVDMDALMGAFGEADHDSTT